MAITTDDFNKIWASTSPLTPYEFSESNYKEGWNFIGSTPPSRQMWDFLQKNNDEKSQFLLNNFDNYLPLSGGTMSGGITTTTGDFLKRDVDNGFIRIMSSSSATDGAFLLMYGKSSFTPGRFMLRASDGTNTKDLSGLPDGTLTWGGQPLLPVGIVQAFAGTTIPTGWLLCDGSAVSRTTYANLFACIGTTYGAGDGSSTFNLPNLVDKFIEGSATAGTEKSAGLPNITGEYKGDRLGHFLANRGSGALIDCKQNSDDRAAETQTTTPYQSITIVFDASKSNSIYGNSTTVQPPSLTMQYIIKY